MRGRIGMSEFAQTRCMRTILRRFVQLTDLTAVGNYEAGKGKVFLSKNTVRQFVLCAVDDRFYKGDDEIGEIRRSLAEVAAVYKTAEVLEKYKFREWRMLEEIRRFSTVTWRFHWRLVESNRDRLRRCASESLESDAKALLRWPFTNAATASDDDFYSLSLSSHRKVMRMFSLFQKLVYMRDSHAIGPSHADCLHERSFKEISH